MAVATTAASGGSSTTAIASTGGVRQRSHVQPKATKLDVDYGSDSSSNVTKPPTHAHKRGNNHNNHLNHSLTCRRQYFCWLPLLLLLCFLVGPELIRVPYALWIWASRGFALQHLLGAGIRPLVDNLLVDPSALIAWPHVNAMKQRPTPLAAYKDVILQEYEAFRAAHEVPVISDLDPVEQGPLDVKGEWKTLFLRAMTRPTCAAPHFPQTIQAVDQYSGFTAYSIMISRLAPHQKIQPHTGFSKMIQVYHLALKVPEPQHHQRRPYLQVQECEDFIENLDQHVAAKSCPRVETYSWNDGEEFIFDDSNPHWVENPTDQERLVLFLHIARVDFKGWRERFVASLACWVFSWVPFPSVLVLVDGTEKTCANGPGKAEVAL